MARMAYPGGRRTENVDAVISVPHDKNRMYHEEAAAGTAVAQRR